MSFNWYVNGDNISTSSDLTYDFEASIGSDIIYEVILDGSSTHSCSSSDTLSITVHPDPIAAIDTLGLLLDCDNLLIDNNLIVAQNLNIVNDNYQWIFTNSSADIVINESGINTPEWTIVADNDSVIVQLIASNN